MNKSTYILVKGIEIKSLVATVKKMAILYSETHFTDEIVIYLNENDPNDCIVNFTQKPDLQRFKYFINYITYHNGFNERWDVKGYWDISSDGEQFRLMLYASLIDLDRNALNAVAQGSEKTFRFSLSGSESTQMLIKKELDFFEEQIVETQWVFLKNIRANSVTNNVLDDRRKSWGVIAFLLLMFLTFILLFNRG